jgi:hypothetical protein
MIRKAIRGQAQKNPALEALLPYVWGNIGFVFTKGDLSEIKKIIMDHRVSHILHMSKILTHERLPLLPRLVPLPLMMLLFLLETLVWNLLRPLSCKH